MMALELLDTKWAGVIQPDPAQPKPASRRENGSRPVGGQHAFVVVHRVIIPLIAATHS
jgi:hypothetical protein